MLEEAGYDLVEQPLVAGIPFEFAAMLAGSGSLDLVAIVDLALDSDVERIRRRIEGLARALDLVKSRRSLTVVLVGPRPEQSLIQAIAGVARVLTVGSPGDKDDASLRDSLAVLLPLDLATEEQNGNGMAWDETRERLLASHPAELSPVLTAASRGENAVTEALRGVLAEPIEELEEDNYEEDFE
jgi:hypothetical protein